MQRKTAKDPISHSADIVSDNIEKLKQLFPSVFTEGKIDFTALRDVLGDQVETDPEYYRFTWPGKQKAKAEARKPSRGTLRPAPEESVDWDTTENLYIEGDNLEVLKLLQKSYAGKIKMIYIDPPYNTGKDFVYKDNYKDNLANYNEQFNRYDEEGNLKSSSAETNQEGNARYHSNWLNMMYPRLTLARNLLTEDGVVFISIDDNEGYNLKRVLDEIFGESNFIASLAVQLNPRGRNLDQFIAKTHESIIIYGKNILKDTTMLGLEKEGKMIKEYNREDQSGPFRLIGLRNRNQSFNPRTRPNLFFPIYINEKNGEVSIRESVDFSIKVLPETSDNVQTCWTWGRDKVERENDLLMAEVSGDGWRVFRKDYLYDEEGRTARTLPKSIWIDKEINNDYGKRAIKDLFGKNIMDFPKSPYLIKKIVNTATQERDIVLDFFSGSGTTGHAVMQLNAEDGGNRKHIQVQLPEPTDTKSEAFKAGNKTIAEIGKERIRRAGKKILEENPKLKGKLDVGFKVFKLDESNIKTWETDPEKLEQNLLLEDVIKEDRSEQDVIYEILLKYGLDLTLPIQEKTNNNQKIYAIGGGALLVCLDNAISPKTAQHIIDWAGEVGSVNPQVVFKDSGFANSQDKVNALQLLKSNGITDVWSI